MLGLNKNTALNQSKAINNLGESSRGMLAKIYFVFEASLRIKLHNVD